MKNSILLSFLALAVLSGLWLVNHDPNNDETLNQESNLRFPNNTFSTENGGNDIEDPSQISAQKHDSIPIYLTLNMALDGIVKDSKFTKRQATKSDFFSLKKSVGNNYSLEYYISNYFGVDMNLRDGEVISGVNGARRLITTMQNANDLNSASFVHRVYGEDYRQIADFKLKAIGFESAESVTVCSGGKIYVDDISGFSNGREVYEYNPVLKNTKKLSINEELVGITVSCINDQLYIIAKLDQKNNTFIFEVKEDKVVKVLEIKDFEPSSSIARLESKGFLLLSDVNTKKIILVNLALNDFSVLSILGNVSVYESDSGLVVVGENERESSISLVDFKGAETGSYSFNGVFMGLIEEPLSKVYNFVFFDKYNKSINLHKLQKGEIEEVKYYFSKYKNFDELIFLWNDKIIELKAAFGL